MFFKENKKKDYKKQVEFSFYSRELSAFYAFLSELKSIGFQLSKIVGELEYLSDFDKAIEQELEKGLFIVFTNDSSLSLVVNKHKGKKIWCVSFLFFYSDASITEKINDFIVNFKSIYYAYLNSYYDIKWQREESLAVYAANNKSLEGIYYTTDIFDNKCIDVSKNYGRGIYKDGILFVAAFMSWFGGVEHEFEDVDISKFDCSSIEKNGMIKVKLFNNLLGDYQAFRDIQKKFLSELNLI